MICKLALTCTSWPPDDPFCGNNPITISKGLQPLAAFPWSRKSRTSLPNIDLKPIKKPTINKLLISFSTLFR